MRNNSLIVGFRLRDKNLEKSNTYEIGPNYLIMVPFRFRQTLAITDGDISDISNFAYIVFANFKTPVKGRRVFLNAFETGKFLFPLTVFYWDKYGRLNLRKSRRLFDTDIYALRFENSNQVTNIKEDIS